MAAMATTPHSVRSWRSCAASDHADTRAYNGSPYNVYFKVFVDLDDNGDFNGAGELAYNAGGLTQGPISGTLNIPVGALVGHTRMRAIMLPGNAGAVGCTNAYPLGETEDYCVDLVDNINGVGESPTSGQMPGFPNPFTSTLSVSLGMNKARVATCTVRALTGQANYYAQRSRQPAGLLPSPSIWRRWHPEPTCWKCRTGCERIVRKVVKL